MNEKEAIRKLLSSIRYEDMAHAKNILVSLLNIGTLRIPTVNDFLKLLHREPLSYGDNWGWPELYWDILSNKFGAKAIRDTRKNITHFVLQLPPVQKLISL